MDNQNVNKKVKWSDMLKIWRYVKSKWVFKIKCDGTFCARIKACEYSQIPRVDSKDNYPPAVNNISLHLLLFAMLFLGLTTNIADVKLLFLLW